MNISFPLLYLRMRDGYTKTDIAKAVGVSRRTVYAWEAGAKEPSADNIVQLARLFQVSTDYLLGMEGTPYAENDH